MKEILVIIVVLMFFSISGISQNGITGISNIGNDDIKEFDCMDKSNSMYFRQFTIPIENNGGLINNGIRLTINANFTGNNYSIILEDLNSAGANIQGGNLTINNNQATSDFVFNGSNASTVYRIIIWNNATNKELTFSAIIMEH